ncbi:MAE_28990/MAE_18760 family HEPN-like nuclease [Bacillus altitudinis]|uniref:MAE_28990/MAE_18760 family HEPN-like nuclease n=1 Tax=Bacillus altitudinis TaxID=293387 RepID=UPI00093353D4|nr:MAE_28990/MAE_18760 family HEPN-like nuclease [Bacillus altitudinis]OJT56066.1 hypothetical protein BFP48_14310 [Bacillus altitudinis]
MQGVITEFEERVKEIDLYFLVLEQVYKPGAQLKVENPQDNDMEISADFLKILKANTFLMIYNLIESSITAGILSIYREIEKNNYSFEKVREEIKEIWLNYHYRSIYDTNANFNSYKNQAKKLVQMAIDKTTIKLDRKAIGISGNLDADQIRILCDNHGIKKNVDPLSKGGVKLQIVREKRNALAHGSLSFLECGREFTDQDLIEIKEESILFTRDILKNIKDYLDNNHFDIANV